MNQKERFAPQEAKTATPTKGRGLPARRTGISRNDLQASLLI
jgi:hypothetical protein